MNLEPPDRPEQCFTSINYDKYTKVKSTPLVLDENPKMCFFHIYSKHDLFDYDIQTTSEKQLITLIFDVQTSW